MAHPRSQEHHLYPRCVRSRHPHAGGTEGKFALLRTLGKRSYPKASMRTHTRGRVNALQLLFTPTRCPTWSYPYLPVLVPTKPILARQLLTGYELPCPVLSLRTTRTGQWA